MMVLKHETQMILLFKAVNSCFTFSKDYIYILVIFYAFWFIVCDVYNTLVCILLWGPWPCGCGAVRHMSGFVSSSFYSFMDAFTLNSLLYRV